MKSLHALSFGLLTLVGTAVPGATQSRRTELDLAFAKWIRDFRAGKIEPGDVWGPINHPYLGKKRSRTGFGRGGPRFSRLDEARDLFRRLVDRGGRADGEALLDVIATSLTKKGGRFWETGGRYSRFRSAAIDAMDFPRCPTAVQTSVADRIKAGIAAEPELATLLLPLLGTWRQPAFRHVLEACLDAKHAGLQTEAAEALAVMGFGPSITAVARAIEKAKYPDDIAKLATSLGKLVAAERPKPKEKDLKYALNLVLDRIVKVKDWRARIALVPILRRIRSRGNVPVLIDLLEESNRGIGKDGRGRAASGTLVAAVQEALTDLTGFWAEARQPERWRAWWDGVKDSFVLPPRKREPPRRGAVGTVASTFFGIPVTGNHVVFVVDTSGSMAWPFGRGVTRPGGRGAGRGRPPAGSFESKIDRLRKELMKAVGGMSPDSKFNVVFFNNGVQAWRNKLVWVTPKNKRALQADLDKKNANGSTSLYDGLQRGMKIKLRKRSSQPYASSVDEIFLLSDGAPTSGTVQDTATILKLVTDWNRGAQVRIHTIYIGGGRGGFGGRGGRGGGGRGGMSAAAFMRKLAEQNHGKFVEPAGR